MLIYNTGIRSNMRVFIIITLSHIHSSNDNTDIDQITNGTGESITLPGFKQITYYD